MSQRIETPKIAVGTTAVCCSTWPEAAKADSSTPIHPAERKEAEEAFRESERRFREMLENVEMIAMTLDTAGAITFCNDHLLKVTGWSREEVMGADWFSKFLPDDSGAINAFFENIQAGKVPAHYENPIKTRCGVLREVSWNNTILRDGKGHVLGTASIGEDVTERKRAEERVRELADMLNHAHDAIIVRNIETGRITFWNQGAERLYGWTAAEAEGRGIGELIFLDPSIPEEITPLLLETGEWHGELEHLTKDGGRLTVSSHATLVRDAEGHPKAALLINIDVSQQRRLEAQLHRTQRLEAIGTLASGLAHDLNNLLAPILMSIPLLNEALAGTDAASVVSTIDQCARRGTAVVRQVLTFSKGVKGERGVVQVHYLLGEMEKIAAQTFPRTITIQNLASFDLWPVVGDATQLQRVLLNLCVNARDAMPAGGTLTLNARKIRLDEEVAALDRNARPGPYLMIEVSDTGHGISPEVMQKIFDPFFTTKEIGEGTGLGLSTALGIVQSHGGFFTAESCPGQGSTFKVFLPAEPDGALSEPLLETAAPSGKGELILIVDDEPAIRSMVQALLEARGYRVLLAEDGTDALAIFAQHSAEISVVVTDLAMPFVDGLTLIRALRKMKPTVRIILSTGQNDKTPVSNLPAELLLYKPYDADALMRALHSALSFETAPVRRAS